MRTYTNGSDAAYVYFDEGAYAQERNYIDFYHYGTSGANVRLYIGSQNVATYALVTDGSYLTARIDVTDIIRAYPNAGNMTLVCTRDGNITIPYYVAGLVNPANVVIPQQPTINRVMGRGGRITMPSAMIESLSASTGVYAEFYPTGLLISIDGGTVRGVSRSTALGTSASTVVVTSSLGYMLINTRLRDMDCTLQYAAVRWVSQTGITRVHTMELREIESVAGDSYMLEEISGNYNVVKGREDCFALYIDGCTAYDVWYYADMCGSTLVEVSVDGVNWRPVDVVTKSIKTPADTNNDHSVTIEVKYKKYDPARMQ